MEEENIPEKIREIINDVVTRANNELGEDFPDEIKHIFVNILFKMYKTGWHDAHELMIESMKETKKIM